MLEWLFRHHGIRPRIDVVGRVLEKGRYSMHEKAIEYARLHQAFLQENRPDIYANLQNTRDVNGYLSSVGQQASEMYDTIMWQKLQSPEVKDLPYMEKVQALEIHRESANEQVLHDIVFQPLPEESPTRRRRSSRVRASTATQGKIRPTTATSEPDGSNPETTLQPIREWEEDVLDYALQGLKAAKQNRKPR